MQEVYGLALAHLAVRLLMVEAAARAGLDPDRLSFTGTLRLLRRAIPRFQRNRTTPALAPVLVDRLLREIAEELLPPRRDRCNPRVVKRKLSKFKLKRPKHANPPKPRPIAEAIHILQHR